MDIYKITNTINKKIYIGKALDYQKRFKEHINIAMNKEDIESHLYSAIRLYGKDAFIIEKIDSASLDTELNEKEKF